METESFTATFAVETLVKLWQLMLIFQTRIQSPCCFGYSFQNIDYNCKISLKQDHLICVTIVTTIRKPDFLGSLLIDVYNIVHITI